MNPPLDDKPARSTNGQAIDWPDVLQQHGRWMRTVVQARLRDAHAADEVMQEIVLAILQQNSRPSDPAKIAPWLHRVAVRHTINYRRRVGRQNKLLQDYACRGQPATAVARNPRDWVLEEESQQHLSAALAQLAPLERELVLLKYSEGWTYKELASHLGVKEKTIEYRLMKARRQLRRYLARQGFGEE